MRSVHPHELRHLASTGRLTRRDALRLGISDADLRRLVASGQLTRSHRGIYAVAQHVAGSSDEPWRAAPTAHLHRAVMLLHALPGSCLTGVTAALAHDLPVLTVPEDVELSRRPYVRCTRPGVALHRPWGHLRFRW